MSFLKQCDIVSSTKHVKTDKCFIMNTYLVNTYLDHFTHMHTHTDAPSNEILLNISYISRYHITKHARM